MGDLSSCLVMSMFGKQSNFSCQKLKWLSSHKKCEANNSYWIMVRWEENPILVEIHI